MMVEILQPHAVAVYVNARHMCIRCAASVRGSAYTHDGLAGEYERALRAEFLAACGVGQRTA